MNTLRNSKGFTLIELIIIIIILGIISAVAIPKYIDMKTEAQKGAAKGILGALASADSILFSKYLVAGSTVNYTGGDVIGNANLSGGATAAISGAVGTITLPNAATYTFTYTAASATSSGQFAPNGF